MATNSELSGKLQILDFCAKNRIPLPEFERQSLVTGSYTVLVRLEVPIVGSDELKRFEKKVTAGKKRDAENQASLAILHPLQSWLASYTPPDLGNIRQKLMVLIQRNKLRFSPASFDSEQIESLSPSYQCTVVVSDAVLDKNYTAVGVGKGKKDAEKDGAYRMMSLLEGVCASSGDSSELSAATAGAVAQNLMLQLKSLQSNSPTTSPIKSSAAVNKNFVNYRSKLNEYCQQNILNPSYTEVDDDENTHRFSTKLSIEGIPNPTRGYGNSKKEASEEAAKLMWNSLPVNRPPCEPPNSKQSQFNPNMLLSVLELNDPNIPLFVPDEKNTTEIQVGEDYIQNLEDKFENYVVQFVAIPFASDEYFYFASVAEKGETPFLAGHGRASSEKEAKNLAAKDCLELYVDREVDDIIQDDT